MNSILFNWTKMSIKVAQTTILTPLTHLTPLLLHYSYDELYTGGTSDTEQWEHIARIVLMCAFVFLGYAIGCIRG